MPPRKRAAPRESKAKQTCKLICCTTPPEALERIKASVAEHEPGKWAEQNAYGPACRCGLKKNPMNDDDGSCPRHG